VHTHKDGALSFAPVPQLRDWHSRGNRGSCALVPSCFTKLSLLRLQIRFTFRYQIRPHRTLVCLFQ
jgi:hypothetical protein